MGQHIQPFLFEGEHLVRVVERSGDPWFFAKDACDCLEIKNHRDAVEKLDGDEKGVALTDTLGGEQQAIIISEGGLYTLILRSRHATTPGTIQHRFRKWVTGEVLPSIRKTGSYSVEGDIIPPTPAEHRQFPDWPLEEMRTKKQVVDMYRLLYGSMAAQWISPQMGFPPPPPELVEHGRQYAMTLVPMEPTE
ncbi:BRO-N domain-containing protein [Pseudochelatococcus sp. B33]